MKNILSFLLFNVLFSGIASATAGMPLAVPQLKLHDVAVKSPSKLRLQDLEKSLKTFQEKFDGEAVRQKIEKLLLELEAVKKEINASKYPSVRHEFATKKRSLLSQEYQVLIELEQTETEILNTVEAQKKMLQEYAADENCEGLRLIQKTQYDFDELQQLSQRIVEERASLQQAKNNKLAITADINKRKKTVSLIQDELKEKRKQQAAFGEQWKDEQSSKDAMSKEQQALLIDTEIQLIEYRQKLAELKITEAEQRASDIDDRIFVYTAQLKILEEEYKEARPKAQVKEESLKKEEKSLETKQQEFEAKNDRLNEKKRLLASEDIVLRQKIQEVQQKYNISDNDVATIRHLDKELKSSTEWIEFESMLNVLIDKTIHDIESNTVALQTDLQKALLIKEELKVSILRTWYKMTTGSLYTEEEVNQETKRYSLEKAEFEAQVGTLSNARDIAKNSFQKNNALLEKIRALGKALKAQKNSIFKNRVEHYEQASKGMYDIEEKKRKQAHLLMKLIELYDTTVTSVQNNIKNVDTIIDELKFKSFWGKTKQSIQWNKLSQCIPDIRKFLADLRSATLNFFSYKRIGQLFATVGHTITDPLLLLRIILHGVIIVITYFLFLLYLPDLINYLQVIARNYPSLRYVSYAGSVSLQFIFYHLTSLYCWAVLFVLFYGKMISDPFLSQLFYLLSIPYLLYMAQHYFAYMKTVNQQRYAFISEVYQERFFSAVSQLVYATIIVLGFRFAFNLGGYQGSQVSNVLMAGLFLAYQITLIYVIIIRGQTILSSMRNDTPLWQWVYEHVNKYFYLIAAVAICIIFVSNPYIGYGRQVIYIISRVFLTALLIPLFSWVHSRIKQVSTDLFFYYTDNDEIKERFIAGRFWYGCFVISSLLLFIIAGLYLGGRIWGHRFTLYDMASWLDRSFYHTFDEAGHKVEVSISSVLQIVVYIVASYVIATIINKFVLRRALDPFLVEPGIQNTVLTFIRYIIVFIGAWSGFSNAGLEGLTTKIAIVLAGVSFAAQEAIRDFFSYFILLVQRPIKIGDLIEVADSSGNRDNALVGVVRHITPRSIIIRQRNSVTVIIPNSRVVMQPVLNWSYSRSFLAFNDIFFTVPFSSDPHFVRQLMLQVLDGNKNLLKTPAPIVRLEDFNDNGYRFLVRGFLTSDKVLDQWDIASDVRLELVKQLRAHNIEIASPVRTLRVLAPSQLEELMSEKK